MAPAAASLQPYGGISIDLSRMDKVIEFREADSDITVQSGIGWEDINSYLADQDIKLFFPVRFRSR
jgi:D-lactate dehydrogenase (cytochrome)